VQILLICTLIGPPKPYPTAVHNGGYARALSCNRQSHYVIRLRRSSPTCAGPSTDSSAIECSNSEGGNICDTIEANTSAAETTRTDSHAGQLRAKAERLRRQADTALTPHPVADRLRQRAATLAELADNHDRTRIALTDEEPA
jgi:hypothetical protein